MAPYLCNWRWKVVGSLRRNWEFRSLICFCFVFKIPIFNFRCDSVDKLRNKMPSLEQEIQDPNKFKEFYQFTFNYGKANNPGQKGKKCIFEIILENIILISFNRFGHRCCIGLLEPHTPRKISTPWYMDDICQGI